MVCEYFKDFAAFFLGRGVFFSSSKPILGNVRFDSVNVTWDPFRFKKKSLDTDFKSKRQFGLLSIQQLSLDTLFDPKKSHLRPISIQHNLPEIHFESAEIT